MPPNAQDDGQFKFLISCIRNSNNGRIDFYEVHKECGIVSKGAAAKRYERMMKSNGIHQSQMQPGGSEAVAPPTPRKKAQPASEMVAKKRKITEEEDAEDNMAKKTKRGRVAKAALKAQENVFSAKDEEDQALEEALVDFNRIKEEEDEA